MKKFSKLAGLLLAMVMVFGLSTTAFAARGNTGSITVKGAVESQTYTAYQIFELTYSGDSHSYRVLDDWADFVENYETAGEEALFTLTSGGYLDPESGVFGAEERDLAEFSREALAYAQKTEAIHETGSATAGADGVVSITGLPLGYYLIDSSLGSLCMLDSTDPDATVNEKNSVPTPNKTVDHQKTEDIANNTTHEFEIEIDNIRGASHLSMDDIMDPELELVEGSIRIKIIDGNDTYEMVEDQDYTVTETRLAADVTLGDHNYAEGSDELLICFYVGEKDFDFNSYSGSAYILITYDCRVNTANDSYVNDQDSLLNSARVVFARNGMLSSLTVAEVDTFGFEIYKYTGEGQSEQPLQDAHFSLTGSDGKTAFFLTEDVDGKTLYLFEGWDLSGSDADGLTADLVSGGDGRIYVEGLSDGNYTLEETAAPDGYNRLDYTIRVSIGTDGSVRVDSELSNDKTVHVVNNAGTALPGTGGMGTTIFYVAGVILILAAVVVLITRRRMSRAD